MSIQKRFLSAREFCTIDWAAIGVEPRRVPPQDWSFSVDPERDLLCTQLLSSTDEMREGRYWYLLVLKGKPFIFEVDAFSANTLGEKAMLKATFTAWSSTEASAAAIEKVASEAHAAVSHRGEELIFSKSGAW